jgi:hypothetical protein
MLPVLPIGIRPFRERREVDRRPDAFILARQRPL